MAEPSRAHWGRLMGASLLVLAAAHLAPLVVEAPVLEENRRLAGPPAWPPRGLDSLRKQTDAWVADRFPARAHLIGAANRVRLMAGVSGSQRVVVGRDGWLFLDDGTHFGAARGAPPLSDAAVAGWLSRLAGRSEAAARHGAAYFVLVPPDKETVYGSLGPAWFDGPDLNRPATMLPRLAAASGAGQVIYPHADIARYARWGLKTYDRYETHWTGLGAYLGYAAFMRELQRQGLAEGPRPLESFTEVRADALNKPRNLALMLGLASFISPDFPELEDPASEATIRIYWLTGGRAWTDPRVVETGQAGKPVLLVTMDSFSTFFLPFLYSHFSRIVIAHNQDGGWREDLIARFKPDIVLTEVVESGLMPTLNGSPPASPQAVARIREVVARREQYRLMPPGPQGAPIEGRDGDDSLTGTDFAEAIYGRLGDDTLAGRHGHDIIRGGRGRDVLDGEGGDDWLAGGREDDVLRGGPGADVFNGFAGAGTDRVLDFSAAEGDRVEIDAGVAFRIRKAGADTVVEMENGQLVLVGVRAATLPKDSVRNR